MENQNIIHSRDERELRRRPGRELTPSNLFERQTEDARQNLPVALSNKTIQDDHRTPQSCLQTFY